METNVGGSDIMELKMENVSKSFQSTNAVSQDRKSTRLNSSH